MQILYTKNAILYVNLYILQSGLYKIGVFLLISKIFCTFAADFKNLRVFYVFDCLFYKQKRPAVTARRFCFVT